MAKETRDSIVITTDYMADDWRADEENQLARISARVRSDAEGDLVSEIVRWQRADGYAQYMVISQKPLVLSHLHIGDGYSVEPALIRGLRLADIREMVERERGLKELFASRKSA